MADTKVSALSEVSVPDLSDDVYLVDEAGPTSYKVGTDRLFGLLPGIAGGRLTLTTGVPVTTSDVTGAGTLYYAPYIHDRITIFDGTRWRLYVFTERSLSLTMTSGKNYDVFIYDNAGTLTLELSAAWTTNVARADALTTQDGVTVKSGATTRLWLGTIRASGTNVTEDSAGGSTTQVGGKRFVWNAYNRVFRNLVVIDTANSWSYATQTWRVSNGATAPLNCVEWVAGKAETLISANSIAVASVNNSTVGPSAGVGIDSASVPTGTRGGVYGAYVYTIVAFCVSSPGIGYHYASWLEIGGDGTCVFVGDNGGSAIQTGLNAQIFN